MRAWFLQGEQGSETDALGSLLRQWAGQPENNGWSVEHLRWTPDLAALVKTSRPNVLVMTDTSCPMGAWLTDVLERGVGVIVATSPQHAEPFRPLAELYALELVLSPSNIEALGLALFNVLAHARRQHHWQTRIDQLQQRLQDRILIERAKGILVERLSISEKEAYDRLRLQSRRQRRPIRDIAQCLLDAQSLFAPEMKELTEPLNRNGQPPAARPSPEVSS